MRLLDYIEITSPAGKHTIELYHGDLTDMSEKHAVDVLVASAFPGDYSETSRSLIGALSQKGVHVWQLAQDKAVDLRETFSCWMSKEVVATSSDIQFDRILVFEPLLRGKPSDVVGDIFQSLIPFVHSAPFVKSVAMPLVATGDQRVAPEKILAPLVEAAVNWFLLGLPVSVIKIVERSELKAMELKGAFSILKQQYATTVPEQKSQSEYAYDFFISYSHDNDKEVDYLFNELHRLHSDVRVFLDKQHLAAGAAWQQALYETLDDCEKIITVYSPTYLTSKVCKEEYNIALMRHREEGDVLVPLYLYSAKLPTYMKLIQFIDCREADKKKIQSACRLIVE